MIVTCTRCPTEYESTANTVAREVGTDTHQVLIICPECKYEKHIYFETPDIAAARHRLQAAQIRFEIAAPKDKDKRWQQFNVQKAAFGALFKRTQDRWKRKRHVTEN